MIYRLGVLLVVVTYASVISASYECICTFERNPVCGSDGNTYDNPCLLKCQQRLNPSLQLSSHGECRKVRDVGHVNRACACPFIYRPVCGSNGLTYPNKCTLACEAPNVVFAYDGNCKHRREAVCVCTLEYNPVCGTDGHTYPNKCALDCEGGVVQINYYGECRVKREVSGLRACQCTREANPVCGNDGKTYSNPCLLNCLREQNENLHIDYPGPCKRDVRVKREIDGQIAKLPACPCTREANPVCGNDGNTYANPCMLNCHREQNENLHIDYPGPCKRDVRIKREIDGQIAKLPACICTLEANPVCGNDGNTYANPCMLNCHREQNENLHIDYPGPCKRDVRVFRAKRTQSSCFCTREMRPVCASNGVTYNNECLMRCAGKNLHVAKYSPCGDEIH